MYISIIHISFHEIHECTLFDDSHIFAKYLTFLIVLK